MDWQSARVQAAMVVLNIIVLLFVASAGSYAGFKNGWKGYEQPDGCVVAVYHWTSYYTLCVWSAYLRNLGLQGRDV